jgi:hypothetical protein
MKSHRPPQFGCMPMKAASKEKHPARCLRHSRIGGRLPTRVCLRRVGPASLLPPPASPAPSARPAATSMADARKPPLNTARRRRAHRRPWHSRRADAPLRDARAGACWHPREDTRSAPPLRRGAIARQFPPLLCRYACQPLARQSYTHGGAPRPPIPPRGPQAPFVGPPGHSNRSALEAPPPTLRCSPAQGLGVVAQRHSLDHAHVQNHLARAYRGASRSIAKNTPLKP